MVNFKPSFRNRRPSRPVRTTKFIIDSDLRWANMSRKIWQWIRRGYQHGISRENGPIRCRKNGNLSVPIMYYARVRAKGELSRTMPRPATGTYPSTYVRMDTVLLKITSVTFIVTIASWKTYPMLIRFLLMQMEQELAKATKDRELQEKMIQEQIDAAHKKYHK